MNRTIEADAIHIYTSPTLDDKRKAGYSLGRRLKEELYRTLPDCQHKVTEMWIYPPDIPTFTTKEEKQLLLSRALRKAVIDY